MNYDTPRSFFIDDFRGMRMYKSFQMITVEFKMFHRETNELSRQFAGLEKLFDDLDVVGRVGEHLCTITRQLFNGEDEEEVVVSQMLDRFRSETEAMAKCAQFLRNNLEDVMRMALKTYQRRRTSLKRAARLRSETGKYLTYTLTSDNHSQQEEAQAYRLEEKQRLEMEYKQADASLKFKLKNFMKLKEEAKRLKEVRKRHIKILTDALVGYLDQVAELFA